MCKVLMFENYFLCNNSPTRAQIASLLRSLDHTIIHTHTHTHKTQHTHTETHTTHTGTHTKHTHTDTATEVKYV